ncbi:MAG TPA: lytic transglycosylase domain-containing protein [Spirochaetia bacterium]|nr:lytic transglycosylase domain-containing protein [Spirochaetia bacterium]
MDFNTKDPAQALTLSPGAPFYLSFIFDSLDLPDQGLRMLEVAWEKGADPWKREAGVLLGQKYAARHDYARAITVAKSILAAQPPADVEQRARRVLVESLYWTQADQDALAEASRLSSPDPEVLLFRGVSSLRLGLPPAHDLILQLFLQQRVSALHGRVFTFIAAEPRYRDLFTDLEWDLISAKNDLLLGDWDAGIPLMESVMQRWQPPTGTLVADLASSCQSAGTPGAGARFLERFSARLSGRARGDALEQAGRLYRRARLWPQAVTALRAAIAASTDADLRDRARWLILDMAMAARAPDFLAQVEKESAGWSNPAVFSDLLEEWISDLVAVRRWDTLAALWKIVKVRGPDDVDARLCYVMARAIQEGLMQRPAASPPVTPDQLLAESASRDPDGYYGLMAASVQGQVPSQVTPNAADAGPENPAPLDPVIVGFLPFGLSTQAYQRLVAARGSLSDGQILEAARLFSRAEDHASSMHLMGLLSRRRALSQEELQLEYPRAFNSVIDDLARQTGIAPSVLYGMIREESFFDPDIVSSAGAVGLSQLMPATAASVARALKLTEPDLKDPATNLAMGVRHLEDLLGKVSSVPKALLSYNAGLTRVRAWERAAGGMPQDLFVESVPFDETRRYVRKILVSSVMYASLYEGIDPREAALSFFAIARK